ncbi:hypothetical protein ACK83U_17890 [Rhizobium sp. WW22]|uniref:hypothetical protein n=1 Tax=Rhizobium sp. WW22 TaxID=3389070 RepID=UPI00399A7E91
MTGQVCGTADLPEAKLARILAWLHEKFTRNFSVGKDLWELVKTHPNDPFFKQFRAKTAILLVRTAAGQLSAIAPFAHHGIAASPSPDILRRHQNPQMAQSETQPFQVLKRPATG